MQTEVPIIVIAAVVVVAIAHMAVNRNCRVLKPNKSVIFKFSSHAIGCDAS